jgi:hypothetical protein
MSGKKHKKKHKEKAEKKKEKKAEVRKAPVKEPPKGKSPQPVTPAVKGALAKPAPAMPGKGVAAGRAMPGVKGLPSGVKGLPAGAKGLPAGAKALAAGGKPLRPKKGGRKSSLALRRGPDGELLAPGDLLLPGGAQGFDEVLYFFRGTAAAEHPVGEEAVAEILTKRGTPDAAHEKGDLAKAQDSMRRRFDGGIEPLLPIRNAIRRNFQGVVERAKHRRREIGAFLRGLDIGRTETSHMDSHGEASLQSLMEWAARLENLADADEPDRADYNQFHRGLDQLENTTEALIVDVEQTLRRLRDRLRSS